MRRHTLLLTPLLLGGAVLSAQSVLVRTLDTPQRGELVKIDDHAVVVDQEGELHSLPRDRVIAVERTLDRTQWSDAVYGLVELADGSQVVYERWESVGVGRLEFTRGSAMDGVVVTTQPESVRSWRVASGASDAEGAQWEAILSASHGADLLVIRREADALDYVEGAIEGVDSEGVDFVLQGDTVCVGWERLYGLVFMRPRVFTDSAGVVIEAEHGAELHATAIRFGDGVLQAEGPGFEARLGAFERIDLSAGKLHFLSDLEVISERWRPALGDSPLPGQPRRDEDFSAAPLGLRFADPRLQGVWSERRFAKGLAVRSGTELVLKLPGGVSRLRGWVGADPEVAEVCSVVVRVKADDHVIARYDVGPGVAPQELDASVAGAQRLTLLVEYGDNLDTGDIVHFADACVTR